MGGGFLGTSFFPDNIVEALLAWFRLMREDGSLLSLEGISGQVIHAFLEPLALSLDPMLRFDRLMLLAIYHFGDMHLLHSLLFVPVGVYSTSRRIFAFVRGFLAEGISEVVEVSVDYFVVQHVVHTVQHTPSMSATLGVFTHSLGGQCISIYLQSSI